MGRPLSRRQLLAGTGLASVGLAAAATVGGVAAGAAGAAGSTIGGGQSVPFTGPHQAGIATVAQDQLAFATYDVTAAGADGLAGLLATWTAAARQLVTGRPLDGSTDPAAPAADTGEAAGLGPSRLTLTVGFGPGLFDDRFGLAGRRPAALADLPAFAGDQLDPAASGGDLCVQACADDAQVAFHAVHNLTRLALGSATLRSLQLGFGRTSSTSSDQSTPRNLLGFKDGTDNLLAQDTAGFDHFVWVGDDTDQPWMVGGTYLVARRIRARIEQWDRTPLADQEAVIGRSKASGAPLGGTHEHDPVDLDALGTGGYPVIPAGAHIRQAAPSTNGGQRILRRGYSFSDGLDPVTGELDVGLFFLSFQRDPRTQFVPIQRQLASSDSLTQYVVHTASALFACPPGLGNDDDWGTALLGDGRAY